MTWKEFLKDYLSFTRKERIAGLCLVGLILVIFFFPQLLSKRDRSQIVSIDTSWLEIQETGEKKNTQTAVLDSTEYDEISSFRFEPFLREDGDRSIVAEPFYFDPNKISYDEWKKLGLQDKTIRTIRNYLDKGGRFYKPEDLGKIYGLRTSDYERLLPYVRIEIQKPPEAYEKKTPMVENKSSALRNFSIDVNTADTSNFIMLPGIGSKLAARIVTFRERLGGFYSLEQIRETYGLPDSTFQKIRHYLKLENANVKKIKLNSISYDELRAHPYIKWNLAQPIIAYREEHGPFKELPDLKKISLITEDVFQKLLPYLSLE